MKTPHHLRLACLAQVLLSAPGIAWSQEYVQDTPPVQFECVANRGIPTTILISERGETPLISWTSTYFSNDGWTPEARCREVTARIARAYDSGNLEYFTTGRINNLPVICSTDTLGGSCKSLIYTLKSYQNPAETLKALLKVRSGQSGPIEETSSRPYIPLSKFTGGTNFKTDRLIKNGPTKPQGGPLF